MKVKFSPLVLPRSGVLVIFASAGGGLGQSAAAADQRTKGQIGRAIKAAAFAAKRDQWLDVVAPGGGFDRVVIFGLGEQTKLQAAEIELLGGAIAGTLQAMKVKQAAVAADIPEKSFGKGNCNVLDKTIFSQEPACSAFWKRSNAPL